MISRKNARNFGKQQRTTDYSAWENQWMLDEMARSFGYISIALNWRYTVLFEYAFWTLKTDLTSNRFYFRTWKIYTFTGRLCNRVYITFACTFASSLTKKTNNLLTKFNVYFKGFYTKNFICRFEKKWIKNEVSKQSTAKKFNLPKN